MNTIDELIATTADRKEKARRQLDAIPAFQEYTKQSLLLEALLESKLMSPAPTSEVVTPSTGGPVPTREEDLSKRDKVDLSELGASPRGGDALINIVKETVEKFEDQEFVVHHVEKYLERIGKLPDTKNP